MHIVFYIFKFHLLLSCHELFIILKYFYGLTMQIFKVITRNKCKKKKKRNDGKLSNTDTFSHEITACFLSFL